MTPFTDEEIHELLRATLHGPLPAATMHRVFVTLAEVPGLRHASACAVDTEIEKRLSAVEGSVGREHPSATREALQLLRTALEKSPSDDNRWAARVRMLDDRINQAVAVLRGNNDAD